MTVASLVDASLRPLDAARRGLIVRAFAVPWLARLLRSRDTRVPLLASIGVITAFALTIVAPGLLFVLGPALLGVLHLASDVRYLVLRQDLPRRWIVAVVGLCAALAAVRVLEIAGVRAHGLATIEAGLGWGFGITGACMGLWAASDRGAWVRGALAALPLCAVMVLALAHPVEARAALAYAHNVVALVLWFVLFRHKRSYALVPLALALAASLALASGATLPWLRGDAPWTFTFMDETLAAARRFPERTALGLGLSYVFLQAVHYAAWLTWIPQEETRSSATLTYRMSVRAAHRDFGTAGLLLVLGAAAVVIVLSFVAVHRTRAVYLSIAAFHAYLEIASLAFLLVRGASPRRMAAS
jgi:hypothetical protein